MSQLIRKPFEFGPGTPNASSNFRSFSVPAHSRVSVAVEKLELSPANNGSIPVIVEVRQASAASFGATGPDGPLLDDLSTEAPNGGVIAFQNTSFSSEFGCPNSWRVRVRSAVGPVPAKVSGVIVFAFDPPGPVRLDMAGSDTQHLDPNVQATRTLRHRAGTSPTNIDGTGEFRIRAKWHTDPADLLHFGAFERLTVALLKPNGTIANSEGGYSQHAPGDKTPKVDFRYSVTADDARLPGDWKLRITNASEVRVVDFDIDKGLDVTQPDFISTFTARCN